MNLHELLETVRSSDESHWRKIRESGPVEPPHFHSSSNGQSITLDVTTHYEQAVYIPDINISLAWGLDVDYEDPLSNRVPRRSFDWAENFINPDVSLVYVDIRWVGTLVHRGMVAHVDGGHGCIPLPHTRGTKDDGSTRYEVSHDEVALASLIGQLTGSDPTEQTLSSLDVAIV